MTGGLLAMLLLPAAVVYGLQRLLPLGTDDKLLCQSSSPLLARVLNVICPPRAVLYVYPGIFVAAALARMFATLVEVCASWAQSIRDSEFLVEMRLRNMEPEASRSPSPAAPAPVSVPIAVQ